MDSDKIYLGDAYELIKQIPDKSVDLIVTDPPYDFGSGTTAEAAE
jgi:DNA modification methylase